MLFYMLHAVRLSGVVLWWVCVSRRERWRVLSVGRESGAVSQQCMALGASFATVSGLLRPVNAAFADLPL